MLARVVSAADAREELEAAIWPRVTPGMHEHGKNASGRAVTAILAAADAYAMALADQRVNRMDVGELRARLRLAEATAAVRGGS